MGNTPLSKLTRRVRRRAAFATGFAASAAHRIRFRFSREELLEAPQAANLLFGQQHIGTQGFFETLNGISHTVRACDFPHLQFLRDPVHGARVFDSYLRHSWSAVRPDRNSSSDRAIHMERFRQRLELVRDGSRVEDPIVVFQRRDGEYVIVDGNHRAAIALVLHQPLRVRIIATERWLWQTAAQSNTFFGAGRRSMPYQSLYDRSREVVRGRRRDTFARIQKIPLDDLRGKVVLDLGCNIGASSFLAADRGAVTVTGVDVEPQLLSSAIRLNSYFALPVRFALHNLSQAYDPRTRVDTVFCFSVTRYLDSFAGLQRTLRQCGARVMYLEGHAGTSADDYSALLARTPFGAVELLGYNESGNPGQREQRPFLRCLSSTA